MDITYGIGRVHICDTHGNTIELRADVWTDVVVGIKAGRDYPLVHIQPTHYGVEWEGVPPHGGNQTVVLRFTAHEWVEFIVDCRAGVYDAALFDAALFDAA